MFSFSLIPGQFAGSQTFRCVHPELLCRLLQHPEHLPGGRVPVPAGVFVQTGEILELKSPGLVL